MTTPEKWAKQERRTGTRYTARELTSATYATTSELGWTVALGVPNVSDVGLCLAVAKPLDQGQVMAVGLLAPGWQPPLKRLGVVVWCAEAGGGTFHAGILFSRPLGPAELRDLCVDAGPEQGATH